jgi:hypothetical protein
MQNTLPLTTFPFLIYLSTQIVRFWPAWLPGGRFRTTAKAWAKILQESVDAPHEYVKHQMVRYQKGVLLVI